jgi:hypothetical protein
LSNPEETTSVEAFFGTISPLSSTRSGTPLDGPSVPLYHRRSVTPPELAPIELVSRMARTSQHFMKPSAEPDRMR